MRHTTIRRKAALALAALAGLAGTLLVATPSQATPDALTPNAVTSNAVKSNPVTPGNFTGFGFDQCVAPTQSAMDTWWLTSPYAAVGIYVSGDSRGCPRQPNLTPAWVSQQLATGWRLLPITLGPQASCTARDRYRHQVRISASSKGHYARARSQGAAEASKTVGAVQRLGIRTGSTLWYDIEAFNTAKTGCRESAKTFLSAWTDQLHRLGYKSGIYSSAASGIKMLDDARVKTPGAFTMPDQLWIADWNGKADVYSSYTRNDGWMPHSRVHQYRGGHNETYAGVTINIDNNWLDLGRGSRIGKERRHCGGVSYNYPRYYRLTARTKHTDQVRTLQCMLRGQKFYRGPIDGVWSPRLLDAIHDFRAQRGWKPRNSWTLPSWMALTTLGGKPVIKYGSAGTAVRAVQRALNASGVSRLQVSGVFGQDTMDAVKAYQKKRGMHQYGVVTPFTWAAIAAGRR